MCKFHTPFLSALVTLESIIYWFSAACLSGPIKKQKCSNFFLLEPLKDIKLEVHGISYLKKIDGVHSYETCTTLF